MARTIDFDRCFELNSKLALTLTKAGKRVYVCYGAFKPTRPIIEYDERWQKLVALAPYQYWQGFVHFWVECEAEQRIYDTALTQFGEEPGVYTTSIDDSRYNKCGVLVGSTKRDIEGKPKINWLGAREIYRLVCGE